ncbi:MAG: BatA domain-containing protein [Lacipirellulaceae bacterium]
MSLLLPSLAIAGGVLALAPVVIHLLSRQRRKRVPWGAIDFLLESDRRSRVWLRLSEWLLVALRTIAIALAGLFVARPQTGDNLAAWWGSAPATTLVLLDDSYSMGEAGVGGSPWRVASDALERIAARIDTTRGDRLVVWRSSEPAPTSLEAKDAAARTPPSPGLNERGPSESAVGASAMLAGATAAIDHARAAGTRVRVVLLGDLRDRDHGDASSFLPALGRLAAVAESVVVAPCAPRSAENLSLAAVTLAPGPVAPGVETALVVSVTNHGAKPTAEVPVRIERDGAPLPAALFPPIAAGATAERRVPIALVGRGVHTVVARLPDDALGADNARTMAVALAGPHEVLLVDGSRGGDEGVALAAALEPHGDVRTGWSARRQRGKRVESLGDLATTAVVALLDVEALSKQAAAELRRHAQSGGGVLLVLGPRADARRFNELVGAAAPDGTRLVPWGLDLPQQTPWPVAGEAGVEVGPHAALRVLAGDRNGFTPLVRVSVAHSLSTGGTSASGEGGATQTLASARGEGGTRAAWIVEDRVGDGRVVTFLAPAAALTEGGAAWSNLAKLPVYPVIANELVGWLAQERLRPKGLLVGAAIPATGVDAEPIQRRDDGGVFRDVIAEDARVLGPGVYRVADAANNGRVFAVNVDPQEGALRVRTADDVAAALGEVAKVTPAELLLRDGSLEGDASIGWPLAALLLALLAGERVLACHASHVVARRASDARDEAPGPPAGRAAPQRRGVA